MKILLVQNTQELLRKLLIFSCLCFTAVAGLASCTAREEPGPVDLMSDTWVATDALGRTMPSAVEAGPVKTNHEHAVGIFYITWHGAGNHNLPGP